MTVFSVQEMYDTSKESIRSAQDEYVNGLITYGQMCFVIEEESNFQAMLDSHFIWDHDSE